jgi:hypothetical protein
LVEEGIPYKAHLMRYCTACFCTISSLTGMWRPSHGGYLQRRIHMATKKRVFISFDFDHDQGAKIMLAGQAKLPDSPFDFVDASVKEPLTGDWKEKVSRRMDNIDLVIVLCGEYTHKASGVAAELTIAREKKKEYFFLAAYSDKGCTKPTSATSSDKLYKWTWSNLKELIGGGR